MGFLAKGILPPELREQILSLNVGELYPRPVKSRYGFHVFKVTDRRKTDFQIMKPYMAEALKRKKRGERIAAYHAALKARYGLDMSEEDLLEIGRQTLRDEIRFNEGAEFNSAPEIPAFMREEPLAPTGSVFDVDPGEMASIWDRL